jgi:hypothetical protein
MRFADGWMRSATDSACVCASRSKSRDRVGVDDLGKGGDQVAVADRGLQQRRVHRFVERI